MLSNKSSIFISLLAFLSISMMQASFIQGTLVKTPTGLIPIQELSIDDSVYSYDEEKQEFVERIIVDISHHNLSSVIHIQANNKHIFTDLDQLFYIRHENAWCSAKDLQPGVQLECFYGHKIIVERVNKVNVDALVYDLTLDKPHTFCIMPEGIIVHNYVMIIPLTLSISQIAYSILLAGVTYVAFDFVQKNAGASLDLNLDISNSNLGHHGSNFNSPNHHDGSIYNLNSGNHLIHDTGNKVNTSQVPTTSSISSHYGNQKSYETSNVYDTRSFPIPKINTDAFCAIGASSITEEPYKNKPACIKEENDPAGSSCGTGLLTPTTENTDQSKHHCLPGMSEELEYGCGLGLHPNIEPRTSCNWIKGYNYSLGNPEEISREKQERDTDNQSEVINAENTEKYGEDKANLIDHSQQIEDHEISLAETIRIIKELADQNPAKIWSKITPTQEFDNLHSLIPKSFIIEVDGQLIYVCPNGAKHLIQETSPPESENKRKDAQPLRHEIDPQISPWNIPAKEYQLSHELLLDAFHEAIQEATKSGIIYNELLKFNSWELVFNHSRIENGHPVLFHAFRKQSNE